MKIALFVEGDTEKAVLAEFLKKWLDPRLPRPVGFKIVGFKGLNHYYSEIEARVRLNLSDRLAPDIVAAIGLLDLYGPTFYPKDKASIGERYTWAKEHLERKVGQPQFRQHFAVHEIEAWLLADPEVLPRELRKSLPKKCAQPESVNFDEPPAKLLGRLYREKLGWEYKKMSHGANLFQKLSPERAYEKCPYLKAMLDDMLALAKNALR
jgi:hypothetical protein